MFLQSVALMFDMLKQLELEQGHSIIFSYSQLAVRVLKSQINFSCKVVPLFRNFLLNIVPRLGKLEV